MLPPRSDCQKSPLMTKGTGGFLFTIPSQTGSLGKITFRTTTPSTTPKAIPNQCAFVILCKIRIARFRGYAFAC
jgi:hypothetical protein